MGKKRSFDRAERVGKHILESLSVMIMSEVRDPRASDAQITEVKVSGDLSVATVYYVAIEREGFDEGIQGALERAAGFLRRQLGQQLRMRHVPQLRFVWDESVTRGRNMEKLLAGLDIPAEEE